MTNQSKTSSKKNISSSEEMSSKKSETAVKEVSTTEVPDTNPLVDDSDSETETESELEDEDIANQLDNDTDSVDDSEDELRAMLNDAKNEKKKREIKGFNHLLENKWYEIRYLSDELKSPMNKELKIRVMVIQDAERKEPVTFVYAPSTIKPALVWEY